MIQGNLQNSGKDCWGPCNGQGPCDYCGTGVCCRKGWDDHSKGCDGSIGGDGYHTCVSLGNFYGFYSQSQVMILNKCSLSDNKWKPSQK